MKKIKLPFTAPLIRQEKTLGWFYYALMLLALPGLIAAGFELLGLPGTPFSVNAVYYLVNFSAVVWIFRKYLGKNLKNAGKHVLRFCAGVVLGFGGYYLLTRGLSWIYETCFPGFSNINDDSIGRMAENHFYPLAVCIVILVPVTEECLYRGLMFRGLYHKKILAWIVSVTAFGASHVLGYLGAADGPTLILCFLQYVPAGLVLAWAYRFTDSVFAPILIHSAVNLLGMLALR